MIAPVVPPIVDDKLTVAARHMEALAAELRSQIKKLHEKEAPGAYVMVSEHKGTVKSMKNVAEKLEAFGQLVTLVSRGRRDHKSRMSDFNCLKGTDMAVTLTEAKNVVKEVEKVTGRELAYFTDTGPEEDSPHPASEHMPLQTIRDVMQPAVGDGVSVLKVLLAEADRIVNPSKHNKRVASTDTLITDRPRF